MYLGQGSLRCKHTYQLCGVHMHICTYAHNVNVYSPCIYPTFLLLMFLVRQGLLQTPDKDAGMALSA